MEPTVHSTQNIVIATKKEVSTRIYGWCISGGVHSVRKL